MKDYWKAWAKAAGLRAVRTFCQSVAAGIGVSVCCEEVNWAAVVSAGALAAILSLLGSLGGLPELQDREEHE